MYHSTFDCNIDDCSTTNQVSHLGQLRKGRLVSQLTTLSLMIGKIMFCLIRETQSQCLMLMMTKLHML